MLNVPAWWRNAKLGIMITWGAYSLPAFAVPNDSFYAFAEWYWFYQQVAPSQLEERLPGFLGGLSAGEWPHRAEHLRRYGAEVTYDDLAKRWQAPGWNPHDWIRLMEDAGARYFVLVAKHHDGIALWPTRTSGRHTLAMGPHRDIVGELFAAANGSFLHPGLFYAMAEWFTPAPHPLVLADSAVPLFDVAFNSNRTAIDGTGAPAEYTGYRPVSDYALNHVLPQLVELIERYKPEILWGDVPGDPGYYHTEEVIKRFRGLTDRVHSDGVAMNDRLGLGVDGDFHTYEVGHSEPGSASVPFEACMSMSTSFGYNAIETNEEILSLRRIVECLIDVVASGGNLLLNIGPMADGSIPEWQRARLLGLGRWMAENADAIYGSEPWLAAQGDVRFTRTSGSRTGYLICRPEPGGELRLQLPAGTLRTLSDDPVAHCLDGSETIVTLPPGQRYRQHSELPFVLKHEEQL